MTELHSNIITESLRDKNRIEWVDRCKCIAIYFVVYGHFCLDNKYVYAFHMPLFFLLSGFVLNEKKYEFKDFLKSRINGILIPYIFFYLLTWLYWLVVERNFRSVDLEWWQPLLGMLYSSPQWNGFMSHNAVLWFLPCLFIVETIVFLILKHVPKISYQVFILTILTILGFCSCRALPWCLNIALSCLQFFYVGRLLRKLDFNGFDRKWILLVFIILASAFLMGIHITDNKVNIVSSVYGSIPEFEIFAYLGIFVFVFLFQIKLTVNRVFKSCPLRYMGGGN